ncbi:DegT/DnrJ/EryC1/StrS family aminotransferase [Entomomonas asaccharolytica]|uniref:DegT/DnrJ/EryC1/StrS family aminotransferase n=1 Tax=Entomomonas asaccharolytica TaxID=2785331 RepID=A0A974ND21_9GAMM|nr:DegT/DnrJ/EryC1/StrS family aminotransferase [Entomomonas asaccharolytica]QQP84309.1 DegT/DnrJ/EryC1/StrS family aminotransferase [Entomomonas asaccharolytica]
MSVFQRYHEIPPTAGLPAAWSDWLPTNKNLTQQISQLFNLPPLQLTCSGTAALVIALTALSTNNPQRKYVIIPAYTCPLVVLAVHHCGLRVKLCDLAVNSFDFDFTHLESLMSDQILAVIPTHLGGRVADVQQTKQLAQAYDITVIEDAAQALGASVGLYGDIIFFSLAAGKGLTLYEGGLLTAHNDILRSQLITTTQAIMPSNMAWELRRTLELLGYTALYNPLGLHFVYGNPRRKSLNNNQLIEAVGDDFGFKLPLHKVSKFRQRIGAKAVARLPQFIEKTTAQALNRIKQLQEIEGVNVIGENNSKGTWPFLMILLPSKNIRDDILNKLWQQPLGVSRLFIHDIANYHYLEKVVPQIAMPNAQDFADRMLTISNSLWLEDSHFKTIFQIIKSCL